MPCQYWGCLHAATLVWTRNPEGHYFPMDPRNNLPQETTTTCPMHPMADGLNGRRDFGWRLT